MPELPEVETIRRGLQRRIVGKKIGNVDIKFPKSFWGEKGDIIGTKIIDINRRAKVVSIVLDNGLNLLFHLKMTGQLIYRPSSETLKSEKAEGFFAGGHPDHNWHAALPNPTTAIIFTLDDASKLFFNDLRKFGWCKVLNSLSLGSIFAEYGPEPITQSGEATSDFTIDYLMKKASKIPNRNIKQFLTDQSIVAGIGNIYVDEALFDARIAPTRKVKNVSLSEWKKTIDSVVKILDLGIRHGGTTDSDYLNADGEKGGMQDYLKVYRKTGQPCLSGCGGKIERIVIGGRGTHFCPNCQK